MNKTNLVVDREQKAYTMSRIFDAPRELVWKVLTDPELIPKWWGPGYLTTTVDRMEFKVGGVWRCIQADAEGNEYAFNGVFREIDPPRRFVQTFEFEPMAGHISTETYTLEELPDGRTRITTRAVWETLEDLEGMLQSGMEDGAVETWDRLDEVLAEMRKEARRP